MDINIAISSEQVSTINNVINMANITVNLVDLWDGLVANYTQICVSVDLQIPILEKQSAGGTLPKTTETSVMKFANISEIIDKKVDFTVNYPGDYDNTRQAVGKATILGYNVKPVV